MANFSDFATPVEQPQQATGFDAVASPVSPPKIPDTSGVEKMAQDNLAANDNTEPQKPIERLNTAAGFDVGALASGTLKPEDMDRKQRSQYVKAVDNGSAVNSSDWMQSVLHAIAPIAAGIPAPDPEGFLAHVGEQETAFVKDMLNPSGAPTNMSAEQYQEWYAKQPKQGYLAQLGEDTSLITGAFTAPFSGMFSIGGATGQEIVKEAYEPEEWETMSPQEKEKALNVGTAGGQAAAGLIAAVSPLLHQPIADRYISP